MLGFLIEGALKKRTRLEWSVERVHWSPWNGIRLREVAAVLPGDSGVEIDALLSIEQVRVTPYWSSLFQKRPEFREVLVEKPEGNIPIELLSLLVSEKGQSLSRDTVLPTLPKPRDPALPAQPKKRSKETGKAETSFEKKKPKPEKKEQKKREPIEKKDKVAPVMEEPEPKKKLLPGRLIVREGRFRVFSLAARDKGLEIDGVELNLPAAGPEAEGSGSVRSVKVFEQQVFQGISFPLRWKEPYLDLPSQRLEWEGLMLRYGGRLQLKGGMRFAMAVQGAPGKLEDYDLPAWSAMKVGIEQVKTFLLRSEGDLRRPVTWRGDILADVRGVHLIQNDRKVDYRFDLGQFVAVFRQGVFQIADMRLRSERASLMGNGIMTSDGRLWSVLRIVADTEISNYLRRVAVGSNLSQGWTSVWLKPMGTPDRRYRDLHVQGKVPQLFVDVGKKNEYIELREIVRLVRAFIRGEVREEVIKVQGVRSQ